MSNTYSTIWIEGEEFILLNMIRGGSEPNPESYLIDKQWAEKENLFQYDFKDTLDLPDHIQKHIFFEARKVTPLRIWEV